MASKSQHKQLALNHESGFENKGVRSTYRKCQTLWEKGQLALTVPAKPNRPVKVPKVIFIRTTIKESFESKELRLCWPLRWNIFNSSDRFLISTKLFMRGPFEVKLASWVKQLFPIGRVDQIFNWPKVHLIESKRKNNIKFIFNFLEIHIHTRDWLKKHFQSWNILGLQSGHVS